MCLVWWMENRSFPCLYSLITEFLTFLFWDKQPAPGPVMGYGAAIVLMAPARGLFQPLQLAAQLAQKVFFLTLLASGSRRGKLNEITARGVQHDEKIKSIFLFHHPGFISSC